MEDSVQSILWQALIYFLGAAGLFAIGGLPLRTYMLIRSAKESFQPPWHIVLLLAASLITAVLASQFLLHLAKCLLGYHCSANAAGGWINAAFIGAIYVCFEIVAIATRWIGGRRVAA